MTGQLLLGVILGVVVSLIAWRVGALSESGAWAAALTGSLVFGLGGLPWAVLLLTFFISSSALSRAFGGRKHSLAEKYAKGSRRDWAQVAANGGVGAGLVVAQALWPGQTWPWIAYVGALAAVNADTWATELGTLSPSPPRLITNGRQVPAGTSGGVTLIGSAAALAGALLIGLAAVWFTPQTGWLLLVAALAGLCGSTVDSLLGASLQAVYFCPACEKETEQFPRHRCGSATRLLRGWRWLDNDLVNAISALVGALGASLLSGLL